MKDCPFPVNVNYVCGTAKNEFENISLLRDGTPTLSKQRAVTKGNINKVNIREENHAMSSSPVMKGKGFRAPRTGPVTGPKPSPNISRVSGITEGWEQSCSVSKFQYVNVNTNPKRHLLSESFSPPMARWVGQRPHKILRNRRANLVSPVSTHDDMQTSSEGCSPDTVGRTNSSTSNITPHIKGVSNDLKQMKMKHEIVSTPGLLSESEDSGAGDNKIEEKESGQRNLSSSQPIKKNKLYLHDSNGDGVRRQGRTGRSSQTLRSNALPVYDRLETGTKPARNARSGYDKSGSKSGRPLLKKSMDRCKFTQLGQIPNGGSPDCSGDSDDDREEILAAAEFVRDSSVMYSNPFWKELWRVFGSVRSGDEDAHYLELELKSSEQLHDKLRQISKCEDNISVNDKLDKNFASTILASEEKEINVSSNVSMTVIRTADVVDNFQNNSILKGKSKDFPPLYQRVLSALIVVDESEEFDGAYGENEGRLNISRSDFPPTIGHRKDDVDLDYDALLGLQMHDKSAPNCSV